MKKKEKIIVIIAAIIIGSISFLFLWKGFYSIDTCRILSQGYIDYALKDAYIRDGRFFLAIIVSFIGLINPSYKVLYIINLFISVVISAITVMLIHKIINYFKKAKNFKFKCIYFLVSYLFIFNFIQIDIVQYLESFAISTSILMYLLSLKNTIISNNKKRGFIYAVIGILWYQGTITMYIATAFLICLLKHKSINKKFLKDILPPAVIIILASLISIIIINIIPIITKLSITERMSDIPSTAKEIISRNINKFDDLIINCFGYFPKYIFIGINLIILITLFVYGIKNKKIYQPINCLILMYVYILSVLVMFPIQSIELCIRVALSIGECIPALFIYLICNTEVLENTKTYKYIFIIVLIIYFLINMINSIKLTKDLIKANELDETVAKRIEAEVRNLQNEGINVQKYAIYYTNNGTRLKKLYNSNILFYNSLYLLARNYDNIFYLYMDKDIKLEKQFTEKDIVDKYFKNPSDEEIQIKYIGDILYIVVDL